MSYVPESNIRVKCYATKICRELPLFNFERHDMWCAWIGHPSEKLWPFEFLEGFRCSITNISIYHAPESDLRVKSFDHLNFCRASVVQLRASRYVMHLNQTFEWKVISILNFFRASVVQFWESRYVMGLNLTSVWNVLTIWISRELLLFNFERLDMWCTWIGHPSEKLWPFEFLERFRCSISSVSIYYVPKSDIRVKS